MLIDRHAPGSTKELFNQKQIGDLRKILGKKNVVISGPPGSGKTTAARLLAAEMGFDVMEIHASELNDKSADSFIEMSRQPGIFSGRRIILVDDLEALSSSKAMLKLLDNSRNTIISTVGNPYVPKLRPVMKRCGLIRFGSINSYEMIKLVRRICAKEKIDEIVIPDVVKHSGGDLRAALIDLECGASVRERESNIYDAVRAVFRPGENSLQAIRDSDLNLLFLWVAENVKDEFRDIDDVARAYDYLSRADIMRSRIIRRQSWSLQKYVTDLLAYGLRSPRRLSTYAPPRPRNANKKTFAKVAAGLHAPRNAASSYFMIINMLSKNSRIAEDLELDENDIDFLEHFFAAP